MKRTKSVVAILLGAALAVGCSAEADGDDASSTAQALANPVCKGVPPVLRCKGIFATSQNQVCQSQCDGALPGLEIPTYIGCCAGFGALDTCIESNFTNCDDAEKLARDIRSVCAQTAGDPNACLANAFRKVLADVRAKLVSAGNGSAAALLCKFYNCDAPVVVPQLGSYTQDPTCPVPAPIEGSEYRKSVYTSTVTTAIPQTYEGIDVVPIRDASGKQPPACGSMIALPASIAGAVSAQLWNSCADPAGDLEFMVSYQPRCSVAPAASSISGRPVGVCIASGGLRALYASTPADMMAGAQIQVRSKSSGKTKTVAIDDSKAFSFETKVETVRKGSTADRSKQSIAWQQTHSADAEWKITTDTAHNITNVFVGSAAAGPGVGNSAVLQDLCRRSTP